jgi:hexosaminidase
MDSSGTVRSVLMKDGQALVRAEQYVPVSKASNKAVSFLTPYSPKYNAAGDRSLVDGIKGTLSFRDNKWLGFLDDEVVFTVDLGGRVQVSRVMVSFLVSVNDGIHAPLAMDVRTSQDGSTYTPFGQVDNPEGSRAQPPYKLPLDVRGRPTGARYVQVRVSGMGKVPAGFLFKGTDAWVFIDEVEVH